MIYMRGSNRTTGLIDFIKYIPDTKNKTIVEVGSWRGESALIFAKHFKRVICIDSWDIFLPPDKYKCTIDDIFDAFVEATRNVPNIEFKRMKSVDAAAQFDDSTPITPGGPDVIYVDAQHIYPQVISDLKAWTPRVKPGGYMAGHDYSMPGVTRAVAEMYGAPDATFQDDSWVKRMPE